MAPLGNEREARLSMSNEQLVDRVNIMLAEGI